MTEEELRQQDAIDRTPNGFWGGLIDFLGRGQYFSAKFFDELAKNGFDAIGDAFISGAAEAISPQERLRFADVLRRTNPDMNPVAREILGFGGDVVLDPTNAVSLGSLGATKIFGKALSARGIFRRGLEIGDALEASGWGLKKLEALGKLGVETKVDDAKKFIADLMKTEADNLGPDIIGNVPNSSVLGSVLKGFGIEADDAYIRKLAQSKDLHGALSADVGSGVADTVMDYMKKLASSPDPKETILADFGQDAAYPLLSHLNYRSSELGQLAQALKDGKATTAEAKAAFELVKKHAGDTNAMDRFAKLFPEVTDNALRYDDLEQVAYRTAEETADKKIADLVGLQWVQDTTGPARAMKGSVATRNLDLLDEGGVKLFGKSVIPGEVFHRIGEVTGLSKLKEQAKGVKAIHAMMGMFNRNFDLPEEYLKRRQDLERMLQGIENKVIRQMSDIFGGLSKEQRELIGKVGHQIQDETVTEAKRLTEEAVTNARSLNPDLMISDREIERLKVTLNNSQAEAIRQKIVDASGLKNDKAAYAAYVKLRHALNEIGLANMRAGMMEEMATNYFPHVYNTIKDPDALKQLLTGAVKTNTPAGEARVFETFEEARKAGWEPEMDAMLLYATRALESKEALAVDSFKKSLNTLYGKSFNKLPANIRKDITLIGESRYPEGWGEGTNEALKIYDRAQNIFKKMATVVRPSFGARQLFSNALQSYLEIGPKAFRAFDPRSATDAIGVILNHYGAVGDSSKWLQHQVIQTPFGKTYTGQQLADLVSKWGVIRGSNIAGNAYERDSLKAIEEAVRKFDWNDTSRNGLKKFAQGLIKYTNWPSHFEDFARTSLFMNALKMGHDPRAALNIVNSALFDYQNGLSRFARLVGQRVFPFISFTNFAVPLVAKAMLTHPSRVVNINKVTRDFFGVMNKLMGGDSLNPSERAVLPGFLLEQNNYLEKLSPDGQALFRTFNSFSPLDVLGGVATDERGDIDLRATIEKVGLSQMSPLIKMPWETLQDKNFFTGQKISTGGNLGDVTPDAFLSNILGLVAGGKSENAIVGLATKYGVKGIEGQMSPELVKDSLKTLLGWEEAQDPRTGKNTVYINPWMAYALSASIPAIGQAIRVSRAGSSPTDKWLDFVLGVGTLKQSLPRNLVMRYSEQDRWMREQKEKVQDAIRQGRSDKAQQELEALQELMERIAEKRSKMTEYPITGSGSLIQ